MKRLELGVFLPIGNNGFLMSSTAPQYHPTFEHNRQIAVLAEDIGLDYVFSMAKWRGYGGATEFWDHTLESMTLMTALAVATKRIGLVATVNPLVFHPALLAKMAATADDVSGGRLGLNLITGATVSEYSQMGVVPPDYATRRYAFLLEWVTVLKRLWTEERVTHHGEYFDLEDCVSSPKPLQDPHPFLVCAGTSAEGMRFTARNADYSFLAGNTPDETKEMSLVAKGIASEEGRQLKTATAILLVQGSTREDAEQQFRTFAEGADRLAIENVFRAFGGEIRDSAASPEVRQSASMMADRARQDSYEICYGARPIIGDAADIAAAIRGLAVDGDLDSVLLLFPDYVEGLRKFGAGVMPLLRNELTIGGAIAAA
jgi:pyrimidine oxygenase